MKIWDYSVPKGWQPQTDDEWVWFLERKINYGDVFKLEPKIVKKYFDRLRIDDGKRLLWQNYFNQYGTE